VADALQLSLVDLVQALVGKQVDRDYLKEAVQTLGINHPTLAKEQAPGERMATRSAGPIFPCSAEAFPLLEPLARAHRLIQEGVASSQVMDLSLDTPVYTGFSLEWLSGRMEALHGSMPDVTRYIFFNEIPVSEGLGAELEAAGRFLPELDRSDSLP
jgi:hypothetical protein